MNGATLAFGLVAGLAVGGLYFAGLWWTVRSVTRKRRPALWLAASFAIRAVLAVGAFAALSRLGAVVLIATLIGFMGARWLVTRYLPPAPATGGSAR